MFEKLVKIHVLKSLGFFVAAYAAAFLGSIWLGMTLTGSSPAPFEFAPSAVFLTVAVLVLTKGFLTVMNQTLCEPESTLLMTLPVSEEVHVWSKIFVGTASGFLFWLVLSSQVLYWLWMDHGIDTQMTSLAAMFIDLDYSSLVAAVSMGLLPVLLFIEQAALCLLMLFGTLTMRGRRPLQKLIGPLYLLFTVLQLWFNIWLTINFETFIGHIHPLALEAVLAIGLALLVVLLYQLCLKQLRYQYED